LISQGLPAPARRLERLRLQYPPGSSRIARADTLTIELVKPADMPAVVMIHWPMQPTVTPPTAFTATVNAAMRIMATAVTQPAGMRARGQ
jgi:hypothetical protein